MIKKSKKHIQEFEWSYFGHMRQALGLSFKYAKCSVVMFVHAFIPAINNTYVRDFTIATYMQVRNRTKDIKKRAQNKK